MFALASIVEILDKLVTAFINSIPALIGLAVLYLRTRRIETNVQKIETATNSMKDALVATTRSEATATATLAEREKVRSEAVHPPSEQSDL
jgi:uncharacterized membrane protein (Fun14 family)